MSSSEQPFKFFESLAVRNVAFCALIHQAFCGPNNCDDVDPFDKAKLVTFDGFVDQLNDDEKVGLVAVFWVGRGSFEPEDIAEALATATAEATTPTTDYLKGSPHLADHLEAGMAALGVDPSAAEDDLY